MVAPNKLLTEALAVRSEKLIIARERGFKQEAGFTVTLLMRKMDLRVIGSFLTVRAVSCYPPPLDVIRRDEHCDTRSRALCGKIAEAYTQSAEIAHAYCHCCG